MDQNTYVRFNGMYRDSKGNRHFSNAHLAYKDRSIIIDYEWCLHDYDNDFKTKFSTTIVPFEIYPCRNDIGVGYAKLSTYDKVDLSDLISKLDESIKEEEKVY